MPGAGVGQQQEHWCTASASTAHVMSVTQVCKTTSERCADILKCGCCSSSGIQDFTCGWNLVEVSSLAVVGGRTQQGAPVFVLSSGSSSHSMGSAVVLLVNQTLWSCGWERKRGKCLCQWWTALVRLLCLAWRMLAVYLLYQVYLVAKGVQIDTNL